MKSNNTISVSSLASYQSASSTIESSLPEIQEAIVIPLQPVSVKDLIQAVISQEYVPVMPCTKKLVNCAPIYLIASLETKGFLRTKIKKFGEFYSFDDMVKAIDKIIFELHQFDQSNPQQIIQWATIMKSMRLPYEDAIQDILLEFPHLLPHVKHLISIDYATFRLWESLIGILPEEQCLKRIEIWKLLDFEKREDIYDLALVSPKIYEAFLNVCNDPEQILREFRCVKNPELFPLVEARLTALGVKNPIDRMFSAILHTENSSTDLLMWFNQKQCSCEISEISRFEAEDIQNFHDPWYSVNLNDESLSKYLQRILLVGREKVKNIYRIKPLGPLSKSILSAFVSKI